MNIHIISMTSIIGAIFNAVGTVIKYSFWSSVVIVGGVGFFAYKTKPEEKTFDPIFKSYKSDPNLFKKVIDAVVIATVVNVVYRDYVFFKIAEIKFTGDSNLNSKYYIGAFQHWSKLTK